jgi:hypothetical protein
MTVIPEGMQEMESLVGVLRSLLLGIGTALGCVTLSTNDGDILEADDVGDGWRWRDGSHAHEMILKLLNIQSSRCLSMEAVPAGPGRSGPFVRVELPPCRARAVRAILSEVLPERRDESLGSVAGPMWLVDLAVRLSMDERVVLVDPGSEWEAALRVLSGRDVQAFVMAPADAARAAGVCVFGIPS